MLTESSRQAEPAVPHQPTAPNRPPYPTHRYAGSDPDRASVGLPGHCERCAEVGHVLAHPEYGCGDVGCTTFHEDAAPRTHPLAAGTRVRHHAQQWPAAAEGTATVFEVKGPWPDGSYEYRVRTGEDFTRRPGPTNPETRWTWWASHATIPVLETPAAPTIEHAAGITTTCFPCPLDCGWHLDEAPPSPADLEGITPAADAVDVDDMVSSMANQAVARRAQAAETALREHLASHDLVEFVAALARLKAENITLRALAAPADLPEHLR